MKTEKKFPPNFEGKKEILNNLFVKPQLMIKSLSLSIQVYSFLSNIKNTKYCVDQENKTSIQNVEIGSHNGMSSCKVPSDHTIPH